MEMLSQGQLAIRWQISPRTLEQWRWLGKGPKFLKIGARVLYRSSDVTAFEQAQVCQNTSGPIATGHELMPKKPSPNLIKRHRIYTVWEAAKALHLHRQTVIRWIKGQGLNADTSGRPWLIKGSDLKVFLGERRSLGKCKLALHQLYCLPCHAPQTPDGLLADYRHRTDQTGNLMGLCYFETYHQLRHAIASVNGNRFRGSSDYEISLWNECARLLTNAIIYCNSMILSRLLTHFECIGDEKKLAITKQVSPELH